MSPSQNSWTLINQIATALLEIYLSRPQIKTMILSDENLGDFGNYIGEWNLCRLIAIGNKFVELVESHGGQVITTMAFVTRVQADLVSSYIGYMRTLPYKTQSEFWAKNSGRPHEGFMGGLQFADRLDFFLALAGTKWNLNVVAFELLSHDHQYVEFFKRLFGLDLAKSNPKNLEIRINENSVILKGSRHTVYCCRNKALIQGYKLLNKHTRARRFALDANLTGQILHHSFFLALGYLVHKIGLFFVVIESVTCRHAVKTYRVSEDEYQEIQLFYHAQNMRLSRFIHRDDLKRYGYIR